MKKIYIAGFDVFKPNSIEIGKMYVDKCKKYGFSGHYPLDNIVDFNQPKQKIAFDIYKANVALIDECDIVIANLNQFRGKEADSGTIWECGYGFAKGKEIYGYMSSHPTYLQNFNESEKTLHNGKYIDKNGLDIEDFELPINLMIACSSNIIFGEFEDVLKHLSKL